MVKVLGVGGIVTKLRSLLSKSRGEDDVSVSVGYTQWYAIFVHERLDLRHPVGQAKFLEQPARELGPELGLMVQKSLQSGQTLGQALYQAGLRLQRESQLLCPVDTGALRDSA